MGYTASLVYVCKLMKSGHAMRVSLPRDVQRHLGVRLGDILALELDQNGCVRAYRLDVEKVRRARGTDDPARSD